MRTLSLLLTLAALTPAASAHDLYGLGCDGCSADHRSAEIAAFEAQLYRRFEAPSRTRRIRAELDYADARVRMLQRQLTDYGRVNRFGTGNALALSADRARLDLRREEIFRRELQEQLLIEQRLGRRSRHVHAYQAERLNVARTRAVAVGDGSITIVNH